MTDILSSYKREVEGDQPPLHYPDYKSTVKRNPARALLPLDHTLSEVTGPVFRERLAGPDRADLTTQHKGQPIGERISIEGWVLDEDGRPVPNTLIEIWQCNSSGRYLHPVDQHDAPLDPNFYGGGRTRADADGGYKFITVKPGAYPWGNHKNAWRPAHIHFSLFGPAFATRLITQMYFPNDPVLAYDPIYNSVPEGARHRLQAAFDMEGTQPDWALAYKFDIVLRGRNATPLES